MAYTLSQFISNAEDGNAISITSTITPNGINVNIEGQPVEVKTTAYDLGKYHTSGQVLRSRSLRGAIDSGQIIAVAGTIGLSPDAKSPEYDPVDKALVGIDIVHHKKHEGRHFYIADFTTLGDGDNFHFGVTAASTVSHHMNFRATSTNLTQIIVYNSSSFSGGTAASPRNSNENSANTSAIAVFASPTITDWGNPLESISIGTAGGPSGINAFGGEENREQEIIMKKGRNYIYRFRSLAASNILTYRGEWYDVLE